MRDAFGGVFTINLLLVFIFIYVAVTAVSLNYAKAYKVKNAVIDFVEQHAIQNLDDYFSPGATKSRENLDQNLSRLSYNKTCEELNRNDSVSTPSFMNPDNSEEYCYKGVVITKKAFPEFGGKNDGKVEGTDAENIYYEIKTYASWDLGAFNKLLALFGQGPDNSLFGIWAIKGEAKVTIKE